MWREWLAVAVGGMLGSMARHACGWAICFVSPVWLPLATLIVNLLGCFAMGAIAQWSLQQQLAGHWWVVGVRVGLLGGLTTFSSFGLDLVRLWQADRPLLSLGMGAAHVGLGLTCVLAGMQLMKHDPSG